MNRTDVPHLFRWVYPSQSTHQKIKKWVAIEYFWVGTQRGLDPSEKMLDVRTSLFDPFLRRELRHVSENEGFSCVKTTMIVEPQKGLYDASFCCS